MVGRIYVIINKINNKVYVGQTVQDLRRRWRPGKMVQAYSSCIALKNALIKYGEEQFEKKVLEDNIPFDKLNEREEFFIKQYDSTNPEKGYNIRIISEGRQIQSEETRKKISEKRKIFVANNDLGPAPNRKEHVLINNIQHKHCCECEQYLPITNFGLDNNQYDKLRKLCKNCVKLRKKKYDSNKQKLSKEELLNTYKNRTQGYKIQAKNVLTGEIKVYNKIRDAKIDGFYHGRISEVLDTNKEYKGYLFTRIY